MARCAAAWRARSAWRAWRRSVAETRDEESRARRFARRRALAASFRDDGGRGGRNAPARRRATIRAAAPLTRRFIFRAWFERWVSGAEARRAARRVATARAEATRDGNAKRRATQTRRHAAARKVFDRMQEARAWTFRVRALTRRWRARAAWLRRREQRERAEAHRFACRRYSDATVPPAEIQSKSESPKRRLRAARVSKDGDGVERVREMTLEIRPVRRRLRRYAASMRAGHFETVFARANTASVSRRETTRNEASTITPLGGGARRRRRRRRARDAARQTRDEKIGIRIDGGTIGGIWAAAASEEVVDAWFEKGRERRRGGGEEDVHLENGESPLAAESPSRRRAISRWRALSRLPRLGGGNHHPAERRRRRFSPRNRPRGRRPRRRRSRRRTPRPRAASLVASASASATPWNATTASVVDGVVPRICLGALVPGVGAHPGVRPDEIRPAERRQTKTETKTKTSSVHSQVDSYPRRVVGHPRALGLARVDRYTSISDARDVDAARAPRFGSDGRRSVPRRGRGRVVPGTNPPISRRCFGDFGSASSRFVARLGRRGRGGSRDVVAGRDADRTVEGIFGEDVALRARFE